MKRGAKVRVFIFSDFSSHVAAWFGHAATCHENTGFVQALLPRHKGSMPRHVALGFLYGD